MRQTVAGIAAASGWKESTLARSSGGSRWHIMLSTAPPRASPPAAASASACIRSRGTSSRTARSRRASTASSVGSAGSAAAAAADSAALSKKRWSTVLPSATRKRSMKSEYMEPRVPTKKSAPAHLVGGGQ